MKPRCGNRNSGWGEWEVVPLGGPGGDAEKRKIACES